MSKKSSGRPSAFQSEVGEEYVSIWISKMYFKLPDWELAKKYGCSHAKIRKALSWVNSNFVSIPNKTLLKGAIFSIEERIRKITQLLENELDRETVSTRSVVELNREIREESRDLLKIQNLYKEKYDVEVSGDKSIKAILQAIAEKK